MVLRTAPSGVQQTFGCVHQMNNNSHHASVVSRQPCQRAYISMTKTCQTINEYDIARLLRL